jgi:hypothetical protein
LPAVAKRGQEDPDVVVAVALVAIAERCAHGARFGKGLHAEVNRLGGVPDEHFGRVRCGPAVDGGVEREPGEPRGLTPHWLVEPAVDDDLSLDARRSHIELSVAAAVHLFRAGDER